MTDQSTTDHREPGDGANPADAPIDPRYDPVFQRGFDGAVVSGLSPARDRGASTAPRIPSPPGRLRAVDSTTGALPAAGLPRAMFAPPSESRPEPGAARSPFDAPSAPELDVRLAEDPGSDDVVGQFPAPPRRDVRRNPFLIALAVVGLGLIGGAVYVIRETVRIYTSAAGGQTQEDYVILQLSSTITPLGLTLGLATLIGVVFVFATEWQRR